jgi:calpain-15
MGPDGQPFFTKPNGNELWVLLLEKACAKWFGSYVMTAGGQPYQAYLFLAQGQGVKQFVQRQVGPNVFDSNNFDMSELRMMNAHVKNSMRPQPLGMCPSDQAFVELKQADDTNKMISCWTIKQGKQAATGASGEHISEDGISAGHAYTVSAADIFTADNGQRWRIVQVRNPWGNNPTVNTEWKGRLSDGWEGWKNFPNLQKTLGVSSAAAVPGAQDGLFYMAWEDFIDKFTHFAFTIGSVKSQINYADQETELARHGAMTYSAPPAPQFQAAAVKKYQAGYKAGGPAVSSSAAQAALKKASKKKASKNKKSGCC